MDYIITTNAERRRLWQRLFETHRLPVKTARPRLMCLPRRGEVLAYDLDTSRLHQFAVIQFTHYLSKKLNMPFDHVTVDNWPILAVDCEPARDVKPAVGFSFMRQCATQS